MYDLFKHVIEECIGTNDLRPEYEMWLFQDVFGDESDEIYEYLKSLTPDSGGWVYWFLYTYETKLYYKKTATEEILEKAKKCKHKYALCENNTNESELLQMVKDGNNRAYHNLTLTVDTAEWMDHLYHGVLKGDFMCVLLYIENTHIPPDTDFNKKLQLAAYSFANKWGYHGDKYNIPEKEYISVYKHLKTLNIPCCYYFLIKGSKVTTAETGKKLYKGYKDGCFMCEYQLQNEKFYSDIIVDFLTEIDTLKKENTQLKTLTGQSLEQVIKNVISEYII